MNENSIPLEELHPTYQQLARIIGLDNVLKLAREIGGEQIYLPKIDSNKSPFIAARNRRIIEEFKTSGATVADLARKYKLTRGNIYEIIGRVKEARPNVETEVKG